MLALFERCYTLQPIGLGGLLWQRSALPGPGSLAEQDAVTIDALEHLAAVHNTLLVRSRKRPKRPKEAARGRR